MTFLRLDIPVLFCSFALCAQAQSGLPGNASGTVPGDSLPRQRGRIAGEGWGKDTFETPDRVLPWRAAAVGGIAASTLGVTYVYLEKTWWSDKPTSFHWDAGGDLKYAHNIDKMAHFYGGSIAADLFYDAARWSGYGERSAAWLGFGLGVFVQMTIELKDGFSPRWGYSVYDVSSGTAGAFFYVGKHYFPLLAAIDVKMSYYKRSDKYFTKIKTGGGATWNDDYINQTYWLSFRVHDLLPKKVQPWWPRWLAVAAGFGVDDKLEGYEKGSPNLNPGNLEVYLALDCDITRILPSESPLWETVKHYLNYIKFPAPAVRITPGAIWYGLYF